MSAIYILWLRQVKRYLRSRSRIVGSLAQPLIFFLAFGFGFGPFFERAGGGDYIEFLAPGIISMSILFTAIFTGIEVIWDKQFGFLKETLVAPVSRIKIMIGRTLGGATVATIQGLVVLAATLFVGFDLARPALLPLAIVFMFLTALFFTALGTAIASILDDMQGFQLIMNFLVMPTFLFSGALFPVANLPSAIRFLSIIDPLSYGVDGLRFALTSLNHFSLTLDLIVLAVATSVILAIGNYFFSKIQA